MVQADGTKTITDSGWTAHSQVGNSFSTSYGDSRSIHFGQPWSRADVDAAVKLVEAAYGRKLFRDALVLARRQLRLFHLGAARRRHAQRVVVLRFDLRQQLEQGADQLRRQRRQPPPVRWSASTNRRMPMPSRSSTPMPMPQCSPRFPTVHGATRTRRARATARPSRSPPTPATVSNESTHQGKVSSKTDIFADSENIFDDHGHLDQSSARTTSRTTSAR